MEHEDVGLLVRGQRGEESSVLYVTNASGVMTAAAEATTLDGCEDGAAFVRTFT